MSVDVESPGGDMLLQLMAWHSAKVKKLRAIQDVVKAGTTVKVGNDEEGVQLTEREAQIFQLGMETVLVEIGKLPLVTQVVSPDDDADEETDHA